MSALTDQIKGKWNQIQGKLKEEYGEWADNQLKYKEGQENQILGQIQEKTGKTKEQIKDWIDGL